MSNLFPLLFPATFFLLLGVERLLPGHRAQPKVGGWVLKCVGFFMIGGVINATVPRAVASLLAGRTLFDLAWLGTLGGALAGILAMTFVTYWTHRTFHRVGPLWRWVHQLHHSAERIDVAGFAYAHPLQLVIVITITQVTAVAIGVTPSAAMLGGYIGFVLGLFEHLDVVTPRWLGFIIQRPESHRIHHQRGVHAYNYSLPLWDMLFGTLRNPVAWDAQAGFWDGASRRVGSMLIGRDVSSPPPAIPVEVTDRKPRLDEHDGLRDAQLLALLSCGRFEA